MSEEELKKAGQKGWGQIAMKSLAAGMRTLPGGYDATVGEAKVEGENSKLAMQEMNAYLESLDEATRTEIFKDNKELEEQYEIEIKTKKRKKKKKE